jgi:glutamate-1-semialdehyde 2,1-aminomutase
MNDRNPVTTRPLVPQASTVRDAALRERARRVIPGGMWGHLKVTGGVLPPSYPQFYERGAGARLIDTDGNEYIDFMCAFGPMIVGYANAEVDDAAGRQQALGDPLTGPSPRLVELAERLTGMVAHADWSMFAKNGTDATSTAVTIARAATGRPILLKAKSAYHGANAWFTPLTAGITPEDRANIAEFEYNDLASLEQVAAEHDGKVAAIIVPPFRHDTMRDEELTDADFVRGVRALADRLGAVLILDEVRTCMRLDLRGSWESYGVRPDLTAFSKSMGNGYPLAALVGTDALSEAAQKVYVTGSFWTAGVPMAAALATLDILERLDGPAVVAAAGERFRAGLAAQAVSHGLQLIQTGPAQMPMLRFADDPELTQIFAFTDAAVRNGVLLHPWHNMFLSTAHTDSEIDAALQATDRAFLELV